MGIKCWWRSLGSQLWPGMKKNITHCVTWVDSVFDKPCLPHNAGWDFWELKSHQKGTQDKEGCHHPYLRSCKGSELFQLMISKPRQIHNKSNKPSLLTSGVIWELWWHCGFSILCLVPILILLLINCLLFLNVLGYKNISALWIALECFTKGILKQTDGISNILARLESPSSNTFFLLFFL